MLSAVFDYY